MARDLLDQAIRGKFGSITGKAGRGLGLPKMKEDAERGKLPGFEVLTDTVKASVTNQNFSTFPFPLRGTAVRWNSQSGE
jgi:hypothetical protein